MIFPVGDGMDKTCRGGQGSGGGWGGSERDADRREASRLAQLSFEEMKADEAIAVALITPKPPRDTGREACCLAWSTKLMLRSFRRSSN